jgi:hypothetical protein
MAYDIRRLAADPFDIESVHRAALGVRRLSPPIRSSRLPSFNSYPYGFQVTSYDLTRAIFGVDINEADIS